MRKIRTSVEVLSQSEVEAVHKATLKILEEVGFKVANGECLDVCEKLGGKVDRNDSIVKVPASLMEQILKEVRKSAGEKPNEEGVGRLKGNISTQVFIVDYKTRTRRYGVMEDIIKGIALTDRLQNISASSAVVVPHDVPYSISDVLSFKAIYTYSRNPGGTYILSPVSGKYIAQMANLMGQKVGYFLETVSPLQFRKESLEMALVFAKQGLPVSLGPMVVGGATGPVTLAGTVTLQNAEILASMFLIYALNCICGSYSAYNHTMDLRTTICSFGSPNQALLGMAAAQMGKFYGFKSSCNSGLSDAITPDFQGGFEKAATAIFSCMAGNSSIGAQGIVGADQGISFEQLVIDNEWLDAYNYILQGMEVNEDTIAVEVIKSVGIGGSFIAEEHTAEYMRDNYWPSNIFNRDNWEGWLDRGSKGVFERASEYVESVFSQHYPPEPVIDQSKLDELDYIAKCAEEELAKS